MAKRRGRGRGSSRLPKTWAGVLLLFLLCLGALIWYYSPGLLFPFWDSSASEPVEGLTVYYLDVGQGDSILLRSEENAMLIDGGPRSSSDELLAALDELAVDKLDYLIATHSHEDHIGGLPEVIETRTVAECWMPDDVADSQIYDRFLTALEEREVPVTVPQAGDTFSFGRCTVTVLAPLSAADEHNNNSLVLRVTCGQEVFLFTGDMEAEEESELLASGADLSANVLKVAHHGSEYTTSEAFLKAVAPELAVISCGEGNSYGHPHASLLVRLRDRGIAAHRTDLEGRITIHTDGAGLSVVSEREA